MDQTEVAYLWEIPFVCVQLGGDTLGVLAGDRIGKVLAV